MTEMTISSLLYIYHFSDPSIFFFFFFSSSCSFFFHEVKLRPGGGVRELLLGAVTLPKFFDLVAALRSGLGESGGEGGCSTTDDDRDDEDYGHEVAKRRKFEPRVSANRRFNEFGQVVDRFLKNGKKLSGSAYGEQRLRSCSNPISTNSRFQKRKVPYGVVEQEEEDQDDDEEEEEEIGGGRKRGSSDMMGELAVQIKEFSERFMRMERKKMEVMRETQRYRMEMENKRMQMILVAQQKTVDMISRAFATAAAPSSSPSSSSPSDMKFHMG